VTEPVIMELLAGARNLADFRKLRRLTSAMPLCAIDPVCDYTEGPRCTSCCAPRA